MPARRNIRINDKFNEVDIELKLDSPTIPGNRCAGIRLHFGSETSPAINIGGPGEVTIESAEEFVEAVRAAIFLAKSQIEVQT